MKFQRSVLFLSLAGAACSPLRSSPHDEKHQLELTIHEVQTNIDDLRHDINCFQTELQIIEGRIKYFENAISSLKQQDIEKQQTKIDQIFLQVQTLEKKWSTLEKSGYGSKEEIAALSQHAEETNLSLAQFKNKIEEIEREIVSQNEKISSFAKIRGNLESLTKSLKSEGHKSYKVQPGDRLETIAKQHQTSIEKIKKLNRLDTDLILVGQELKIPTE